jgi:lycopene cyclase domain-containing protein
MPYTYLLVDVGAAIVPFLFSFHPKLRFNKQFGAFAVGNIIASIVFLIWDGIFTAKGVWGFNPRYVMGIYVYNMPLEELLFFICIPFACTFTYHCLAQFHDLSWKRGIEKPVVTVLAILLLLTGFVYIDRLYTSVSFISTAVLLLALIFVFKVNWLARFLSVYIVLLLPFFIVNGILTGSGLEEPVVWYNNNENLGIRMFTIPFEDIFYGLEMMLLNLFFYERYRGKLFKPAWRNSFTS